MKRTMKILFVVGLILTSSWLIQTPVKSSSICYVEYSGQQCFGCCDEQMMVCMRSCSGNGQAGCFVWCMEVFDYCASGC